MKAAGTYTAYTMSASYEEWRRLSEHYQQMLDGELLQLANDYSDLTEVAQQVLREEMLKRGLGDPLDPKTLQQTPGHFQFDRGVELNGAEESIPEDEEGTPTHEYTWKTPLCECETAEQANQIGEVLHRAGIDCWINDSPRRFVPTRMDLTNIRIQVAADQLEEARRIIAQPIPQDIIEDSQIEVPEFAVPKCPGCGDSDPTLLEADPGNRWACEVCGKEWTD